MAKIELVNLCKELRSGAPGVASRVISSALGAGQAADPKAEPRTAVFSITNLNLTIPHGRTMVLLGPSGCGKTTLLRIIAGLIEPDSGQVLYDGKDMKDVPPGQRQIGMVFQSYALYPHMKSKANILSYFLFKRKTPELDAEAEAKYKRTSELMGVEIEYLQDRMPVSLSGGEKQRVALARCITRDPVVFLLDEPFSNLDQKLREKYRVNLKTLLNQFNVTTVYVTHDQNEAMILADSIAIMDIGRIEQIGSYEQLYDRPKNIFVAEFLTPNAHTAPINLLDGERVQPGLWDTQVGARPEDIKVSTEPAEDGIRGIISNRINLPVQGTAILSIRVGENQLTARIPVTQVCSISDPVWLHLSKYHVFSKKTGVRLRTVPD